MFVLDAARITAKILVGCIVRTTLAALIVLPAGIQIMHTHVVTVAIRILSNARMSFIGGIASAWASRGRKS